MKIRIREKDGHGFCLVLLSALLFSSPTAMIMSSVLRRYGMNITKEQLGPILRELRRFRKECPDRKLVEIREHGGELVEILL